MDLFSYRKKEFISINIESPIKSKFIRVDEEHYELDEESKQIFITKQPKCRL